MTNLENEISLISQRIEKRNLEIDLEVSKLSIKINQFSNWAWFFVWSGLLITVFGIIYYYLKNTETGYSLNLLGDFMAGTVSSIWSLAGIFFIYVAFLGQKQQLLNQQLEIMLSQLEVKYTRLELSGQKKEMATQNKTLKQQKFENTFFNLLNLHHQIVNSIDLLSEKNITNFRSLDSKVVTIKTTGKDCFVKFREEYTNIFSKKIKQKSKTELEHIINSYNDYYKKYQSDLGHYFRNLYHIFKFIKQSEIDNKKMYTSLVRAQLSNDELFLLFYNSISSLGNEKFKPLIEEYQLLKNLSTDSLLNQAHFHYYKKSAFKE